MSAYDLQSRLYRYNILISSEAARQTGVGSSICSFSGAQPLGRNFDPALFRGCIVGLKNFYSTPTTRTQLLAGLGAVPGNTDFALNFCLNKAMANQVVIADAPIGAQNTYNKEVCLQKVGLSQICEGTTVAADIGLVQFRYDSFDDPVDGGVYCMDPMDNFQVTLRNRLWGNIDLLTAGVALPGLAVQAMEWTATITVQPICATYESRRGGAQYPGMISPGAI